MKHIFLLTFFFAAKMAFSQTTNTNIPTTIIALEKAALEKWNHGDPTGYLDLSADDVVYFDPFTDLRLNGLRALKKHYAPINGKIHVSKYEMINPKVQVVNKMAVLTFNLFSYENDIVYKWNCTEVYRFEKDRQWKIIQTHWSFIKPTNR